MKNAGGGSLLFRSLTSFETLCAEYWIAVNKKMSPSSRDQSINSKLPAWVEKSVKE